MSQILPEAQSDTNSTAGSWKVVIYDNDHTPEVAVLAVLMHATGCEQQEAEIEVWEAQAFGRANVHFDKEDVCHSIAAQIGRVGVRTTVEPEWQS